MSKGISTVIGQILSSLFLIGLVSLAIVILHEQFTEVHIMIEEEAVERHTIGIANVIMASSDIVHEKNGKKQRAIINEIELDNMFLSTEELAREGPVDFLAKTKDTLTKNEFFQEYSYPNTFYFIIITDLEDEKSWFTFGHGPGDFDELIFINYLECLFHQLTEGDVPSVNDRNECFKERRSDSGAAVLSFPVNIRTGYSTHMGSMEIISKEV